jgi:hypothetical protein
MSMAAGGFEVCHVHPWGTTAPIRRIGWHSCLGSQLTHKSPLPSTPDEGGGTISFVRQIENDDLPILVVYVVDPGPQPVRLFSLYHVGLDAATVDIADVPMVNCL